MPPAIPDDFPKYRPRRLPFGGHGHTVWAKLGPSRSGVDEWVSEEIRVPLSDDSGDVLLAKLIPSTEGAHDRPLVILVHGLGGRAESDYMLGVARTLIPEGHRLLLVNNRGAGSSGALCRRIHHPGRTDDLRDVLRALQETRGGELISRGVVLVGISLGGNLVLKALADLPSDFPIRGGAVVSAPLDLSASAKQLSRRRNWVHNVYVMRKVKDEVLRDNTVLTDEERQAVRDADSIYEFDRTFTAPHFGEPDVEAFYREHSSVHALDRISVPTLLVYASDDPFVSPTAYRERDWSANALLLPLLVDRGGHVGFVDKNASEPWHERCLNHFLKTRLMVEAGAST